MATASPTTPFPAPPAELPAALPWWRDAARLAILSQIAITGGPLLVGSIFHIGVPVYATLFGPLGQYNCLLYTLTGHPCPACGLTSSVISTLHGRPDLALAYNPVGIAFVVLFLGGLLGGLLKWRALTHPLPAHPAARWLMEFPPGVWMNWIALAMLMLYVGRACFWVSAALA